MLGDRVWLWSYRRGHPPADSPGGRAENGEGRRGGAAPDDDLGEGNLLRRGTAEGGVVEDKEQPREALGGTLGPGARSRDQADQIADWIGQPVPGIVEGAAQEVCLRVLGLGEYRQPEKR